MATFRLTRIEPPDWATQPSRHISMGVTVAEFGAIQQHRDRLLGVVHREAEAYLNDPRLVSDGDEEGFPELRRMTGAYYVGDESYEAHRDPPWFQIGVTCHCLEHPKPGVPREDDYLGLQVWLRCEPGRLASFEVFRNIDSSSI